jgi:hypothetical protein
MSFLNIEVGQRFAQWQVWQEQMQAGFLAFPLSIWHGVRIA